MTTDTTGVDRALGAIGTTFRLTRLWPPPPPPPPPARGARGGGGPPPPPPRAARGEEAGARPRPGAAGSRTPCRCRRGYADVGEASQRRVSARRLAARRGGGPRGGGGARGDRPG